MRLFLSSVIVVFLGLFSATLLAEEALLDSRLAAPKLLPASQSPLTISLKEALDKALENHATIRIAKLQLEKSQIGYAKALGSLLPQIEVNSSYTRNIPEMSTNLYRQNPAEAELYRNVAGLLRKNDQKKEADELEKQADLLIRRNGSHKIISTPRHEFESQLQAELQLLDPAALARVFLGGDKIDLSSDKLALEKAQTAFLTIVSYYLALQHQDILVAREAALKGAEERLSEAKKGAKRPPSDKDLLLIEADYLEKESERQAAALSHRSAIGSLGGLIGLTQEFHVERPELNFPGIDGDAEALIETALKNRADLKALRQALTVLKNETTVDFWRFFPKVSLKGAINYSSNDEGFRDEKWTGALSINANMPLFSGGARFYQLKESRLLHQEAEISLRELERDIAAKIRGRKEKISQLEFRERAYREKERAFRLAEKVAIEGYRKQRLGMEELLDIINRGIDAETKYRNTQSEIVQEKAALAYESGLLNI